MVLSLLRILIKWYGPEAVVDFVRAAILEGHNTLEKRTDRQTAVMERVGQTLLRLDAAKRELPPRT